MIIFRKQKEYSSGLTKATYRLLKIQDKIDTWGANIGDKAKRTWNNNSSIPRIYKPESNISLKKKAIEARNSMKLKNIANSAVTKIKKTKDYLNFHTPGEIIKEGLIYTGKNPIAAVGTAAGYASTPITGTYIPGTTGMALGAEGAVRKIFPKYAKGRDSYKNKKKHPIPEFVEKAVNTGVNIAKATIPI